jgi:membrane protein required for colicin V production
MMGSWNWLDWILIAILLISLLAGARKGFLRELIGLASLVAGLALASAEYRRAAVWLEPPIHSRDLAFGVAFLSLFVGVLIAGALISALARKLVHEAGIDGFDRFLGAIFGLVRGIIVGAVVLMAMVAFAIKPVAVQRSRLAPYVSFTSHEIAGLMPPDLRGKFQAGFEEFKREAVESEKRAPGRGLPQQ